MNDANYMPTAIEGIALNEPQEKRIYTDADFANVNKDELIFQLWRIIDNIDTFGDMAKSNDKAFRSLTEKEQRKRWEHASPEFIDHLYDKFYDRSGKNGAPRTV